MTTGSHSEPCINWPCAKGAGHAGPCGTSRDELSSKERFTPAYIAEVVRELESRGWQPDSRGDPECVDEASAAGADIIKHLQARLSVEPSARNLGRDAWPETPDAEWLRKLASEMFSEHHMQHDTHNRLLQIAERLVQPPTAQRCSEAERLVREVYSFAGARVDRELWAKCEDYCTRYDLPRVPEEERPAEPTVLRADLGDCSEPGSFEKRMETFERIADLHRDEGGAMKQQQSSKQSDALTVCLQAGLEFRRWAEEQGEYSFEPSGIFGRTYSSDKTEYAWRGWANARATLPPSAPLSPELADAASWTCKRCGSVNPPRYVDCYHCKRPAHRCEPLPVHVQALLSSIIETDPDDMVADAVTALDAWRQRATQLLGRNTPTSQQVGAVHDINELLEIARDVASMDCFHTGNGWCEPECPCLVARAGRAVHRAPSTKEARCPCGMPMSEGAKYCSQHCMDRFSGDAHETNGGRDG